MYGKIFARTFEHSMMGSGSHVFAVMSYVIAKTIDSHITLKPDYLAFVIGDTRERIEEAIKILASPDPESTGKEYDGRRIVPIDGVPHEYFVPRHEHYRGLNTSEDVRAATRERVRRFRAKQDGKDDKEEPASNLTAIYDAYPKKMGRPKALAAIEQAVEKFGYDFVLEKTKAYATARIGQDPRFTPLPATWFNQQRFNDDPSTWKNENRPNTPQGSGSGRPKYGPDNPIPGNTQPNNGF